jgi:hypothetical protein
LYDNYRIFEKPPQKIRFQATDADRPQARGAPLALPRQACYGATTHVTRPHERKSSRNPYSKGALHIENWSSRQLCRNQFPDAQTP